MILLANSLRLIVVALPQHAVMPAVSEVYNETHNQPRKSRKQRDRIKRKNQRRANQHAKYRYQGNQWSFEGTRSMGIRSSHHPDAGAHEYESEERTETGKVACHGAGHKSTKERNENKENHIRFKRRPELGMKV